MSTGQLNVKPLISHRLELEDGPETFHQIINRLVDLVKVIIQLGKGNCKWGSAREKRVQNYFSYHFLNTNVYCIQTKNEAFTCFLFH
ncbi:hypothetical protein [Virgibacillus sp. Bac332]|uniref:hypothetical protein n=1 Tax=Virgibacillus TaxID=84406 RepID=UPI0004790403